MSPCLAKIQTARRHCTLYDKNCTPYSTLMLKYHNNHLQALNTNAVNINRQMVRVNKYTKCKSVMDISDLQKQRIKTLWVPIGGQLKKILIFFSPCTQTKHMKTDQHKPCKTSIQLNIIHRYLFFHCTVRGCRSFDLQATTSTSTSARRLTVILSLYCDKTKVTCQNT